MWRLLAECEKKEMVDVEEECLLVEEPEDEEKRKALLRNANVSGQLSHLIHTVIIFEYIYASNETCCNFDALRLNVTSYSCLLRIVTERLCSCMVASG